MLLANLLLDFRHFAPEYAFARVSNSNALADLGTLCKGWLYSSNKGRQSSAEPPSPDQKAEPLPAASRVSPSFGAHALHLTLMLHFTSYLLQVRGGRGLEGMYST